MHTGKQKQMNASYQASLVNRHIRRFTGTYNAEQRRYENQHPCALLLVIEAIS